jgi:uncharacterized protein YdiU (UPF0061 family)
LSTTDILEFDNRFTSELPADPNTENSRRQVKGACYSRVKPTPVANPLLVAHSLEMAEELGLPESFVDSERFAQVFGGNSQLEGMDPFAMCYGGHQFGNWAAQLGDGRAINLGETVNTDGNRWVLQLKGAGPTPYSRTADGLAVLRSSVREFLCSEAMFHLGVPTTRALSLVLTGEPVLRDMFYDGNAKEEPGAVVCRVSPSFIRFGNFQIFASRGEHDILKQLVDYTIRTDFPHLGAPSKETYLAWFSQVCERTALMIAHWMRVGFVHGVMNTDNMSILGLTIDYGPYGWLEDYDPDWTPNTTDAGGRRYRFGHQSQIAHWNLVQLAQAIHPLIEDVEPLQEILNAYPKHFESNWQGMISEKLGFKSYVRKTDDEIVSELNAILQLTETDMTLFYRRLAELTAATNPDDSDGWMDTLSDAYYKPEELTPDVTSRLGVWVKRYIERVKQDGEEPGARVERMNKANPIYVLRNYLAQVAIDKSETGDHTGVVELLDVLRNPYQEQPGMEQYAEKRPEWARHRAGCSMLSCSS